MRGQELVGPRSNRGDKIQNGRHVNKGKTHLRLVRALVGSLFQQVGEIQNLRLII